jgi:uncharacterized protein YcfJ
MKTTLGLALAAAGLLLATQAAAQITFYERDNFEGRSFAAQGNVPNFADRGFNDRASSVEVHGTRWQICEGANYTGRCVALVPGRYPSLASLGMENRVSSVRTVPMGAGGNYQWAPAPGTVPAPAAAPARITFFERERFEGRTFTTQGEVRNFERAGFNDRASSVEVSGTRWEVCEDSRFRGQCVILRPGRYPSLRSMGLNNQISSVRQVPGNVRIEERRYAPPPVAVYDGRDYRRRQNERLYEADVVSVRAVVGTPEQRCWVEREQVQSGPNVGGAIAGAVIGGILGHQIGSGSGQDVATAGGAVAGAAIGANVNRGAQYQDVQRCTSVPNARPDYWDVVYTFRGQQHRVQLSAPPGRTVTVNEHGEPRA